MEESCKLRAEINSIHDSKLEVYIIRISDGIVYLKQSAVFIEILRRKVFWATETSFQIVYHSRI